MIAKFVDVVGDAPVSFLPAQLVRQLDFDRTLHCCDDGLAFSALQAAGVEYHEPNALDCEPFAFRRGPGRSAGYGLCAVAIEPRAFEPGVRRPVVGEPPAEGRSVEGLGRGQIARLQR